MNDLERKELDRVRAEASTAKSALTQAQQNYATAHANSVLANERLRSSLELALRDKQQAARAAEALQTQLIASVTEEIRATPTPDAYYAEVVAENERLRDQVSDLATNFAILSDNIAQDVEATVAGGQSTEDFIKEHPDVFGPRS